MKNNSKIASIVIPCSNQLKFTKICVESVYNNTKYPYELIVIDNGSTDGTREWFDDHKSIIKLISNEKNYGAPKAFNQGIDASKGKYIVFLNNDTIVTDGWLNKLVDCAEADTDIGIVGPLTNQPRNKNGIFPDIEGYRNEKEIHRTASIIELKNKKKYEEVPGLTSFCMLVKRNVIEDIGKFDEEYGLGTNDDHDFCLRARMANYKIMCSMDTFIFHFYNRTLGNFNINEWDRKNREYFVKKFGNKAVEYLKSIDQPYGTRGELSFGA